MENNIQLFEDYLFEKLSPEEKQSFETRLKSDKSFAADFRIYLITVKAIHKEAEEDNIEFGYALKHLSKPQLLDIIGKDFYPEDRARDLFPDFGVAAYNSLNVDIPAADIPDWDLNEAKDFQKSWKRKLFFERFAWAASIVVVLVIGLVLMYNVSRSGKYALDNTLVAYNYIPTSSRGGDTSIDISTLSNKELKALIPQLREAYDNAPSDDVQECEETGMQLAMAYLKLHERTKAVDILNDLASRFSDDEAFAAQCKMIINQLE